MTVTVTVSTKNKETPRLCFVSDCFSVIGTRFALVYYSTGRVVIQAIIHDASHTHECGPLKNQAFSRQFYTAEARGVYMGFVADKLALRQVSGFSYFSPLSFRH